MDSPLTDEEIAELGLEEYIPITNGGFSSFVPNGWSGQWQNQCINGHVHAIHRFVYDEFVHLFDWEGTCICGPHLAVVSDPTIPDFLLITHNEWDGAEEDWDEED